MTALEQVRRGKEDTGVALPLPINQLPTASLTHFFV